VTNIYSNPNLSLRRRGFHSRLVHSRFALCKIALGQVFLRVIRFCLSVSFRQCCIRICLPFFYQRR